MQLPTSGSTGWIPHALLELGTLPLLREMVEVTITPLHREVPQPGYPPQTAPNDVVDVVECLFSVHFWFHGIWLYGFQDIIIIA